MSSEYEWPIEVWAKRAEERRKDPWNRIVDIVYNGKLSPERAETLARERGLDPFATRPASGEHDPTAAMDWTLAMATAWIIWRTPQAVQECMEAHVGEVRFWAPHHYRRAALRGAARWVRVRGFELKTPDAPTPRDVLDRVGAGRAFGSVAVVEPGQAERELRDALRRGDLVARAGRQADPIEKTRWIVLSPFARARHGGPHDAVYDEDGEVQFSRVTVERDAVLETWRSSSDEEGASRSSIGSMRYRTGSPGRPGSIHLVVQEFERRIGQGKVLPRVAGEAKALAEWLLAVHPDAAPCGAENIENRIREKHRELFPKGRRGQKMKAPD